MIGVSAIIQNNDKEILLVQERKPAAYGKFNLPGEDIRLRSLKKYMDNFNSHPETFYRQE